MVWEVQIRRKAGKNIDRLPAPIKAALTILIREMEFKGPIRGNWPNYGRLGRDRPIAI